MLYRRFHSSQAPLAFLLHLITLALISAGLVSLPGAHSAAAARDNTDPVHIAVLTSSDFSRCFTPGVTTAIQHFTKLRAKEINARGGMAGRTIILKFYDHFRDTKVLQEQVTEILKDPNLVAIMGISSSSRGATVVEQIGKSGVPLISGMSRGDIFAPYPNAFSLSPAVSDEIAAIRTFIEGSPHKRPFFVGLKGDIYAEAYAAALLGNVHGPNTFWVPQEADDTISNASIDKAIDAIVSHGKDANGMGPAHGAGLIYLGIHSGPGARLLKRLVKRGLERPVFVALGRIARMLGVMSPTPYNADMYQLGREQVPHVFNERLQQRIWTAKAARWIFEDKRAANAPPACAKEHDPVKINDPRTLANRRAVGRGTQYADILALLAHSAGTDSGGTIADLRQRIIAGIVALKPVKKVYRGLWQDWSFTAGRSVAEDILILHKPAKSRDIALADLQYRRGRHGNVRVPVIYTGIDVTRIFRVDSNEKTFHAEFYLSLRNSHNFDISDLEFANAFRSPLSNEPVLSARTIEGNEKSERADNAITTPVADSTAQLKLYKVTGKFYFTPDLRRFPFDRQRLSISIQPKNTARPFLLQPPPPNLRKADVDVDNWLLESQYVGLDRDIITVIGAQASSQYLIPLTTFNFTWTVKRLATDHYLQVMVPLFIILLVTWLSTLIPAQRLESVVAIQVTALLSSIALYLAVPKVDFDHATVSDILFVMTYLAISLMLGLSILRANLAAWRMRLAALVVGYGQIFALPLMLALLGQYLVAQNQAVGHSLLGNLLQWLGVA